MSQHLANVTLVITHHFQKFKHSPNVRLLINEDTLDFYQSNQEIDDDNDRGTSLRRRSKPLFTINYSDIYSVFRYGKAEQFKLCVLPQPGSKLEAQDCYITLCCDNVSTCDKWIEELSKRCIRWTGQTPANVLVFVNPTAEARAEKLYQNVVGPMLKLASDYMPHLFSYTHVESQFRNHAYKLLNEGDLIFEYNVILAIGGDGLVHEVVNGILDRPDAQWVKERIAIAVIPAGASNSLATTLNNNRYPIPRKLDARSPCLKYKQLCAFFTATTIKGLEKRMDILETYQNGVRKYSATTTLAGLFSDVVSFAEKYKKYRLIGDKGYILGALRSIRERKYFPASLQIVEQCTDDIRLLDKYFPEYKQGVVGPSTSHRILRLDGEFLFIATVNNDHIDRKMAVHKDASSETLQSGEVELLWMRKASDEGEPSRKNLLKAYISSSRNGFLDPGDLLRISRVRTRCFKIEFTNFDRLPNSVTIDGEITDNSYSLFGEVKKEWLKVLCA